MVAVAVNASGCVGVAGDALPGPLDAGLVVDAGGDPTRDAGPVSEDGGLDAGPAPDAGPADGGLADSGTPDGGPIDPCASASCATGSHCVANPARCVCNPGYIADAGACTPGDPGIPALRSQQQVCDAWKAGNLTTTSTPFTKTSATCDPGVLSRAGLDDTLTHLNMHRWLVGLGPVSDDATLDDQDQKCAVMSAWNPPGPQAHNPPPTSACYTSIGAGGAGSSNIAWGPGSPQGAIDQWLVDNGNETTMGHRRWLLNPTLDPIGMGYYEGGTSFGSAACIGVFSGGNTGPHPTLYSLPSAGFAPIEVTQWIWSIHGSGLRTQNLAATVTRASDGANLAVTVLVMPDGYGEPAITLDRQAWQPAVGETYRVHVTATGMADVDYEVTAVSCP